VLHVPCFFFIEDKDFFSSEGAEKEGKLTYIVHVQCTCSGTLTCTFLTASLPDHI